jgi:hypothetical protein
MKSCRLEGVKGQFEGREKQHFRYIPKRTEGKMINFVGKQKPRKKRKEKACFNGGLKILLS